jgi:hypothetical protein
MQAENNRPLLVPFVRGRAVDEACGAGCGRDRNHSLRSVSSG